MGLQLRRCASAGMWEGAGCTPVHTSVCRRADVRNRQWIRVHLCVCVLGWVCKGEHRLQHCAPCQALQGWAVCVTRLRPRHGTRDEAISLPKLLGARRARWDGGCRWGWVGEAGRAEFLVDRGVGHLFGLDPARSLFPPCCRKLYWTDGDNISVANMDGSNRTLLFTNQKGPVGTDVSLPCRHPLCSASSSQTPTVPSCLFDAEAPLLSRSGH